MIQALEVAFSIRRTLLFLWYAMRPTIQLTRTCALDQVMTVVNQT